MACRRVSRAPCGSWRDHPEWSARCLEYLYRLGNKVGIGALPQRRLVFVEPGEVVVVLYYCENCLIYGLDSPVCTSHDYIILTAILVKEGLGLCQQRRVPAATGQNGCQSMMSSAGC